SCSTGPARGWTAASSGRSRPATTRSSCCASTTSTPTRAPRRWSSTAARSVVCPAPCRVRRLRRSVTRQGESMSTDAIVLLKEDHKTVKGLFKEFQSAQDGPLAAKAKIVEQILRELTVHTYIENEVMYPEVRKLLPDLEDDVLESYEEHHV